MIPIEYFSNFNVDRKSEFIRRFILNPLFESYTYLKDIPGIKSCEEPEITRELYLYIKNHSSISKEIQKHIIIVILGAKEVKGQKETEPDLQFILPNCFRVYFEAKRIHVKDSYYKYCGNNGLGRFLSGYYSSEDMDGGMIAYVQKGNILDVRRKLVQLIQKKDCSRLTTFWKDFTFLSVHNRAISNEIKIYHTFFNFT